MNQPDLSYTSKQYRINRTGNNRATFIIAVPPAVIWREARIRGLEVDEFIKDYCVVAHFDGSIDHEGESVGLNYTFERIKTMSPEEQLEDDMARLQKITDIVTVRAAEIKERKIQEAVNVNANTQ